MLHLPPTLPCQAVALGNTPRYLPGPALGRRSGVNLYYCTDEGHGFFVEVGIDDGKGQAVVLRSFVSSVPLEDYAHGMQLPEKLKS